MSEQANIAPATYANLAGDVFTYKNGSAIEWSQWSEDDDSNE